MGAVIATIATTVAADVTGILLASLVAALGLFIIPARRRKAKKELGEKITDMRDQLMASLRIHFKAEIKRSLQHIEETISPYTRFVRAEQGKNLEAKATLEQIQMELSQLQGKVNAIGTDENA